MYITGARVEQGTTYITAARLEHQWLCSTNPIAVKLYCRCGLDPVTVYNRATHFYLTRNVEDVETTAASWKSEAE